MSPEADEPNDDEPRDPFLDEEWGAGPWHYSFRQGEMLFLALAELPTFVDVLKAMQNMPASDLRYIVGERLYSWHAAKSGGLRPQKWLYPPESDS